MKKISTLDILSGEFNYIKTSGWSSLGLDTSKPTMWSDRNRGGTFIYDASKSDINDGGVVFDGWVRQFDGVVNIKWFGAKGDGSDESTIIQNWLSSSSNLIAENITISVTQPIFREITDAFKLVGNNFKIVSIRTEQVNDTLLEIKVQSSLPLVYISGVSIDCDNKYSLGLFLNSATKDFIVDSTTIDNIIVNNVTSDATDISSKGIESKINGNTIVQNCTIKGIHRLQSNDGVIASMGLSIKGNDNKITINNNKISNVDAPSDEIRDADAIQVFSNNKNIADIHQDVFISIYNNEFEQCSGRFIKIQASDARVYNNRFRNIGIELNAEFHFIDFQWGGGYAYNNEFFLDEITGATGAPSFVNFGLGGDNGEGGLEFICSVSDNTAIIGSDWYYFTSASSGNKDVDMVVDIKNNTVTSLNDKYIVLKFLSGFTFTDKLGSLKWNVIGNNTILGHGYQLVRMYNSSNTIDDVTWSDAHNDKIKINYSNNKVIPQYYNDDNDLAKNYLIRNCTPRLKHFTISNNEVQESDIRIPNLDIRHWESFNSDFRYDDDGQGNDPKTGLLGVPNGFETDVYVECLGSTRRLTKVDGSAMTMRVYNDGQWKITELNESRFITLIEYHISKNADYTASRNDYILADTSSESFTITLPADPIAHDVIKILDAASSLDTNPLVISRNGNTIMGLEDDIQLDIKNREYKLIFTGSDWRVI